MGEKRQSFTIYASESRNEKRTFQVALTKETLEALRDLDGIRNWNQLRHLCEQQERRRKKGRPW